jgi:hypothetical protein
VATLGSPPNDGANSQLGVLVQAHTQAGANLPRLEFAEMQGDAGVQVSAASRDLNGISSFYPIVLQARVLDQVSEAEHLVHHTVFADFLPGRVRNLIDASPAVISKDWYPPEATRLLR